MPNIARVTKPSQDVRRQVKVARSALDLTQQGLARRARVSRGSVQNLENGMRLDETTEAKIEAALGKPAGWLEAVRSGRPMATLGAEEHTRQTPDTDAPAGTLGEYRRRLAYFHRRLRDTPEDFELLLELLDLSDRLGRSGGGSQDQATQGGLGMSADSEKPA